MRAALLALSPREHGGQFQYTSTLIDVFQRLAARGLLEATVVHLPDYAEVVRDRARDAVPLRVPRARADVWLATYLGTRMRVPNTTAFDVAVSPKACLAAFKVARRSVVTVHDLQHRHLPNFHSAARRGLRDWLYRRAAEWADAVICETQFVKRDIATSYGVPLGRIHVVPSPPPPYILAARVGESVLAEINAKYRLPGEYLFYPAQFWRHKNHVLLVEALSWLKAELKVEVPLVLVGRRQGEFEPMMRRARELGVERQVRHLGYVPDRDIPYLFKAAAALVVPSLFESLSIPVWEAFHLGVPVACANTCSFPEQVGDAALLFDPTSPRDCGDKIYRCLTDPDLARQLVSRGRRRVARLTLERYSEQWWEILQQVAGT